VNNAIAKLEQLRVEQFSYENEEHVRMLDEVNSH
jgi:hypothetical protein